jgi:ABC-type polysaccharide/polyol phosphate transport system ATPase subunit
MPTTGAIRVFGRTSFLVGLGTGMNAQLSGSENVILMGTMMGIPAKVMIERMQSILEFADLKEFASTPVKYYSNGMRQRLAFSTATEITPDILLSDEVFAGGDGEFINKAKKRIHDLIDRTNIFIFVSHNLPLLESLTQRTIWIEKGIIKADGSTKDVCKEYKHFIDTKKKVALNSKG